MELHPAMAESPGSSDLSSPPSEAYDDHDDQLSTVGGTPAASSRPSVDITHIDHLAPPAKRRRIAGYSTTDRAPSSQPELPDDVSLSSDSEASAPGTPSHDEYTLREDAQTKCLWHGCPYDDLGGAMNNDDLVAHVQATHCATGGPKRKAYLCLWGECQKKNSSHPSGYALKAHMRSHTKEKPYYCALPECDRAFTRSDALAKHMRTVHEPEAPSKSANPVGKDEPTPPGKKSGIKLKLSNGTPGSKHLHAAETGPIVDEDGNEVDPSPPNDNITYIPAHHPITGQPGFMIHYPPDIHFSAWESSIAADQLLRLLRRQLHWAQREGDELKKECEELERTKREEFQLKEILLDGVMASELARASSKDLLRDMSGEAIADMSRDTDTAGQLTWSGTLPPWHRHALTSAHQEDSVETPGEQMDLDRDEDAGSPPPTGHSGGFDGSGDPYDNYVADQYARYEEKQRQRSQANSAQVTPQKQRGEVVDDGHERAEQDAVGALMGLSSGMGKAEPEE